MIKSIGGRDEDLSIVSGFDRMLYDAFKNALERGQTKGWQQIIYFIQKELINAFGKDSGAVMQQLNWLPSAVYNLSAGNPDASKTVAKEFGSFFKTVSWIFNSEDKSKDPIQAHPLRFNMFFKILMNFYHYAIHHPDETVVRELINQFKSIAGDDYDFDTRFEIQDLESASQEQKKSLREAAAKEHLLTITQRRCTLTLVAWLTFLFLMEKLSEERFSFLLKQFDLRYNFFEELLDDMDYIRSNERADYLGISFWDYMERESGVMYSPPSSYDWILYGPALILLREPLPNFSLSVIVDDRQHAFLLEAMKQKLKELKLKIEKFSGILGWDNPAPLEEGQSREGQLLQLYQEREDEILEMFQAIKTLNEEEDNRQLAARPLDQERIKAFLETLYQKWLGNCQSYQLFREKQNFEAVDSAEGLDFHGQSILLEHQRTMFVEGEQQTVYGSEDLGSALGRWVDERFIYDVTKFATQQRTAIDQDFDTVTGGLDASIAALRAADNEPDMIIVPSTYFYKSDLVKSAKYHRSKLTDKSIQIGVYDGIPVLRVFAQGLTLKAIVASFKKGLSLSLYEDPSLYKGIMHIDLRELTAAEIDEEYVTENVKWTTNSEGIKISERQARLRLAASLMLEMWTRGKFKVVDPKAVTWCRFSPAATANESI
jgi:hypothetical protein